MTINTATHPKLLWPGIHAIWGQVRAAHAAEYTDLYHIEDSEKAYEQDVQVTGFPLAQIKAQGAPGAYADERQGTITTYQHIPYALGYICTYEEIRDNLYSEVAMRRAKANAFAIDQTLEQIGAFPYNNAFSSTYFNTADGLPLCSASHINPTGGTYSNLGPAADLSEASLEDLNIQIMRAQNSEGQPFNAMARSLHISPYEWYNANRVMKSVLQSSSSSNNINVLKATNAFPEGIKLNHYFTSPHAYFVRTNVPNGMTMFWRDRPSFAEDNDFDTKNQKAMTYFRCSVGATDPLGIFGCNGP